MFEFMLAAASVILSFGVGFKLGANEQRRIDLRLVHTRREGHAGRPTIHL